MNLINCETKKYNETVIFVWTETMETTRIREELQNYINEADDRFVQMVYAMMKVNQGEGLLTEEEQKAVDQRVLRHRKGESKSFTWSETRQHIEK